MTKKTAFFASVFLLGGGVVFSQGVNLWGFDFYHYAVAGSSCRASRSAMILNDTTVDLLLMAGRVTTTRQAYPWAGVSVESSTLAQIERIKTAKGIRFWVLSTEERDFLFGFKLSTISDDDHYCKTFRAFTTPAQVEIFFNNNDLHQRGFGVRRPFDQTKSIGAFIIQTVSHASYDYTLQVWGLEIIE
jgi:hypothetical protein